MTSRVGGSVGRPRQPEAALGGGPLSLSDRLLVTVIHHRWKPQHQELTRLLGSPRAAVNDAIHEMTPVLDGLDHHVPPAPITVSTARDLTALIDKSNIKP